MILTEPPAAAAGLTAGAVKVMEDAPVAAVMVSEIAPVWVSPPEEVKAMLKLPVPAAAPAVML